MLGKPNMRQLVALVSVLTGYNLQPVIIFSEVSAGCRIAYT